jgi:hypothetical protein
VTGAWRRQGLATVTRDGAEVGTLSLDSGDVIGSGGDVIGRLVRDAAQTGLDAGPGTGSALVLGNTMVAVLEARTESHEKRPTRLRPLLSRVRSSSERMPSVRRQSPVAPAAAASGKLGRPVGVAPAHHREQHLRLQDPLGRLREDALGEHHFTPSWDSRMSAEASRYFFGSGGNFLNSFSEALLTCFSLCSCFAFTSSEAVPRQMSCFVLAS